MLLYLPIFIFAILEGEIYYSKACADVRGTVAARGEVASSAFAIGALMGLLGSVAVWRRARH